MRARLATDFERFRRELPRDFPLHVLEHYGIDLSTRVLGAPVPHPIGKGSGQLSLNADQLEADRAAGLAFTVLKTVIAEDPAGDRTMGAWAIHETRMRVERRRSAAGREGWTVTWKGRGWDRSFDDYLALVRTAGELTRAGADGLLAFPSVKYHLPHLSEPFRDAEYTHTTAQLRRAWGAPLLIEKDFSPTLAGDPLADERAQILRWLQEIPARIRGAVAPGEVRIALKLMNARFDEEFQLAMLRAAGEADAIVAFNRLWDAERGIAFGGFDLSDRNLGVLAATRATGLRLPPLVGTGNVCSGRMLVEYARLGCEAVELHTYFQLPLREYPAVSGSRTQRALHALVFDPRDGLVAALLDLEETGVLHRRDGVLHFADLAAAARRADGGDGW